jgi:hypothetical protein
LLCKTVLHLTKKARCLWAVAFRLGLGGVSPKDLKGFNRSLSSLEHGIHEYTTTVVYNFRDPLIEDLNLYWQQAEVLTLRRPA